MPIKETLNAEMTQVTGIMYVQGYVSAGVLLFAGKLIQKVGLKKLLIPAAIAMALVFFFMSRAESIGQLLTGCAILGFVSPFVAPLPGITLLNRWFSHIAGTLTGIVMCMASLSAFLLTPTLIPWMGMDYQKGFMVYSILAVVLAVVPAVFLVVDSPEKKGLKPWGYGEEPKKQKRAEAAKLNDEYYKWGLTLSQALKSPLLWLVAVFICVLVMGGTFNNYWLAYMQEAEIGIAAITLATGFRTFAIWLTCIGNGWIGDKFGPTKVAIVGLTAIMVGFLTVLLFAENFTMLVIGMVIYSFCMSIPPLALSLYVKRFFGLKNYAAIASILTLFFTLSGALGHTITGIIYDATGSYTTLFIIFIGLVVVAYVCVGIAEFMQKKKVPQYKEMTYRKDDGTSVSA
jgi:sugar phosphate permease